MDQVAEFQKRVTTDTLEAMVRERIGWDLEYYGGVLPREVAVSWSGYVQSAGEWSPAAASRSTQRLRAMLPPVVGAPHANERIVFPVTVEQIERRKTIARDAVESTVRERIVVDRERYGAQLPREIAVWWSGYLQALGEWCPASFGIVAALRELLPDIPDDPSEADNGRHLRA